jgi:ADP-L-glycero-D-manno-heptose 6-epimerase
VIIVTGGAGFIGSNLVRALNRSGREDIVVVDDLSDGSKFRNIADCMIADYLDKDEFRQAVENEKHIFGEPELVFHQGACSDTTEWDGRMMLDNNYSYSKQLLHYCLKVKAPFIYASSAAVYGIGEEFREETANETPINVYAYSKLLFDNYVRSLIKESKSQIVGLRYFNVYGPGEAHKKTMASVVYHFNREVIKDGRVKLFGAHDGYAEGEQLRDFIHVDDAVAINLWFMQQRQHSGVFNVGTGRPRSFNDVAKAVIDWHGSGEIEYISFPQKLMGSYQSFTRADLSQLSHTGCVHECKSLETGIKDYLSWLNTGNV